MIGCGYRESCRKLFVELKILPLASQYIFSLLLFVVNNRNYFIPNSVYHDSNTRHRNDLHLLQATLAMYQKGVYYSGIKVFNGLPRALKDISSKPGKFKIALRKFLQTRSFYSLDEFFDKQWYFLVSIPLSYIFISIHWNIFCVIFTSILCISVLYFYCLFFKCMASYTTEPIYWLFLHPLDTFLYMEFWEINKYKYKYHCLTAFQKHHILKTGSDLLTKIRPNTVNITTTTTPHLRAEIVPIYKSSVSRMLHFNQTMDEDQMKWQDTGNRFWCVQWYIQYTTYDKVMR